MYNVNSYAHSNLETIIKLFPPILSLVLSCLLKYWYSPS